MKTYTLILTLSLISAVCHAHTMHDGTHTHTLLDFDKGVLEKQGGTADHYHDDISVKHTHNGIETGGDTPASAAHIVNAHGGKLRVGYYLDGETLKEGGVEGFGAILIWLGALAGMALVALVAMKIAKKGRNG